MTHDDKPYGGRRIAHADLKVIGSAGDHRFISNRFTSLAVALKAETQPAIDPTPAAIPDPVTPPDGSLDAEPPQDKGNAHADLKVIGSAGDHRFISNRFTSLAGALKAEPQPAIDPTPAAIPDPVTPPDGSLDAEPPQDKGNAHADLKVIGSAGDHRFISNRFTSLAGALKAEPQPAIDPTPAAVPDPVTPPDGSLDAEPPQDKGNV